MVLLHVCDNKKYLVQVADREPSVGEGRKDQGNTEIRLKQQQQKYLISTFHCEIA